MSAMDWPAGTACVSWQDEAIEQLRRVVAAPELVREDCDGDVVYPEEPMEEPGWVVWGTGGRLRMYYGCLTFECDVHNEGVAAAAERLLAAADAWSTCEPGPAS